MDAWVFGDARLGFLSFSLESRASRERLARLNNLKGSEKSLVSLGWLCSVNLCHPRLGAGCGQRLFYPSGNSMMQNMRERKWGSLFLDPALRAGGSITSFLFACRLPDNCDILLSNMEKIVRKFRSFEEADDADYEYYRTLSGDEKLQLLLDLIMPENPDAATVERSARVHPLTEHEQC